MTTYLADFSNFKSKEEMDKASNQHVAANRNQLNQTDKAVLDMIRRYSVKYGAAHLKHETIAKGIGKSVSTIRRSLKKLESLSIIQNIKFIRKVLSGLGANIYSILPFYPESEQGEMNNRKESAKSHVSKTEGAKSENEPLSNKSLKDLNSINTYTNDSYSNSQSFYCRFKQTLISMLGEDAGTLTGKLYGIYRAKTLDLLKFEWCKGKDEQFEIVALQSLLITLQTSKKKPIRSITGFFNGVYSNLISKHIIGFGDDNRVRRIAEEDEFEWAMPPHLQQSQQSQEYH